MKTSPRLLHAWDEVRFDPESAEKLLFRILLLSHFPVEHAKVNPRVDIAGVHLLPELIDLGSLVQVVGFVAFSRDSVPSPRLA
jgi:hypothetical protein